MSKDLIVQTPAASTPSSHWRAEGAPDPHAGHYDGERAALTMGKLTDDELANGAFMNYDQPLNLDGILAGTHSSPIAWMTAVKDRIRWLSRSLEKAAKAEQERDALALRVSELTCQIDRAEEAMVERDALAAELKAVRGDQAQTTNDINLQEWKGVDGACAWHLIDRHAEDWHHTARLMNAWLEANREDLAAELKAMKEQEPAGYFWKYLDAEDAEGVWAQVSERQKDAPSVQPLYAHPISARKLTDEAIQSIWNEACNDTPQNPGWNRHIRFARAIERYLKGEGE